MKLAEGMDAPLFVAQDQNGHDWKLEDHRGKYVLLYFYPKDNTPGCTKEACGFQKNYAELEPHVEVVGVSADSSSSHQKFRSKYGLEFTLLTDPNKEVIDLYGANNLIFPKRVSFLIDSEGKIAKVYGSVKAAQHPDQVLKDVQALLG